VVTLVRQEPLSRSFLRRRIEEMSGDLDSLELSDTTDLHAWTLTGIAY
jgi:hypothetical protein